MTAIRSATSIASSWSWVTLLVVQAPQPLPQFGPHRGVEGAERFVEQQHARLHGQRPRERHPLALAA
jgi:hypothetical protein